jgi:hypothetical protein
MPQCNRVNLIQNANSDYGSSAAKRLYSCHFANETGWMDLQGITLKSGRCQTGYAAGCSWNAQCLKGDCAHFLPQSSCDSCHEKVRKVEMLKFGSVAGATLNRYLRCNKTATDLQTVTIPRAI